MSRRSSPWTLSNRWESRWATCQKPAAQVWTEWSTSWPITTPSRSHWTSTQKNTIKATFKSLTVEAAKYLLARNMRPSEKDPNLFTNGRDPRQTIDFYFSFPQEFLLEMAKRISCDFYTIKVLNTPPFEHPKYSKEVEAVLRESTRTFERVEVEGTHHVHMLFPERVYEPIMRWLRKEWVVGRVGRAAWGKAEKHDVKFWCRRGSWGASPSPKVCAVRRLFCFSVNIRDKFPLTDGISPSEILQGDTLCVILSRWGCGSYCTVLAILLQIREILNIITLRCHAVF